MGARRAHPDDPRVPRLPDHPALRTPRRPPLPSFVVPAGGRRPARRGRWTARWHVATQDPFGQPQRPEHGGGWAPPGGPAGGWGAPPGGGPAGPDVDGPPPPPWERRRRSRRTGWLVAAVAVVLVAGGTALAVATLGGDDEPSAAGSEAPEEDERAPDGGDGADPGPDPGSDGGPPDEVPPLVERGPDPAPVDPTGLAGLDAAFAQLLNDVDASERAMIGFQDRLAEAFLAGEETDPDALFTAVAEVASDAQEDLARVRRDLTVDVDDDAVAAVRDRYVTHLDAWVAYLEAIEADPSVLAGGPEDRALTVAIDTTGDAFARELREALPEVSDADVVALAEGIIERGFPERDLADEDTV
ncbi:hypothetical protein FTX61_14530 [Nitriliruptoraceae bacterium ZYF776]|nr:hypothetical protein [Profundirhabdus halotolerans]